MDQQTFLFDLMRIKFGFMACFHYIFVPLTLGLIVAVACMESVFVWTRDAAWRLAAHFWFRLFTLGWLLGIVTGYPLRGQLTGEWGNYFSFVKPILEQILPIEAALGPVMLVGVGTIAIIGPRLYPATRAAIAWCLVLTMVCQSVTILSVNAWMQHPTGVTAGAGLPRAPVLADVFANPMAISKIAHVFSAALVCGSTLVCVIAALYLYRRQHIPFARVSLRLGVPLGALSTALVLVTGHFSADHVARFQPMKFASFEGLWKHEEGPAGLIIFARPQVSMQLNSQEIKIPYAMSVLAGYGLSGGSPRAIQDLVADDEDRIRESLRARPEEPRFRALSGYRQLYEQERTQSRAFESAGRKRGTRLSAIGQEQKQSDASASQKDLVHRAAMRTVPNVPILFGGFRVMVGIGLCLLAVFTLALLLKNRVLADQHRRLLLLLPAVLPLPWLASTSGWIIAEMGRQPWVVYGFLPTLQGAQLPPLATGVFGTLLITSAYILLGFLFMLMSLRLIRRGPGTPFISASWWQRLAGTSALAAA
jgi:cytochrome bd ubiquinol oxidase subunit I